MPRDAEPDESSEPPTPGYAWKTLALVNDWVKHAETKAAATLAATGVTGGVLYNLVKDQRDLGVVLAVSAFVCGLAVVAAGFCAVCALWPRLRAREPATSRLYFDHISRRHPRDASGYQAELRQLTSSPEDLVTELGQQVWSNSDVATRKYWWSAWAIVALVVAVSALGVTALDLALVSIGVGRGS